MNTRYNKYSSCLSSSVK